MTNALGIDAVLVRLSFLVQSLYADICAEHGLTPAQAQLLCVIKDQTRGMSELTHMLRLEKSSVSGLVDRVEQRGLLRRDTTRQDRRAVTLTPTARGKRITEAFYAEVSQRLLEAVDHLPGSDRRHFERIATSIVFSEAVPAVFGNAREPASGAARV